jgi:hypothetical protein
MSDSQAKYGLEQSILFPKWIDQTKTWIWVLLYLFLWLEFSSQAAEVGLLHGEVQRYDLRQNVWKNIITGGSINSGERIRPGNFGRVELIFKNRRYLRLAGKSEILVHEQNQNKRLVLDVFLVRGKLWTSVLRKLTRRSRLRIRTPVAVIDVKGTQFNTVFKVRQKALEITVLEGKVEVLPRQKVDGPQKVEGPDEITGPSEILQDEWLVLVSSGQLMIIESGDVRPRVSKAKMTNLENVWIRFNRERDSSLQ